MTSKQPVIITATFGFDKIGSQSAHFSVTGEVRRKGAKDCDMCGCIHDEIARHFPELRGLIKWHLCSVTDGPMHYLANAQYWWELATGESRWAKDRKPYDPDPMQAFRSTVVYGALADDAAMALDPKSGSWPTVAAWLTARLPALMAQFRVEMDAAGVPFVDATNMQIRAAAYRAGHK